MKQFIYILAFLFSFFFQHNLVFAEISCPNFEFLKNMQKGEIDEEVYVLQQILNLDKRTMVSQTGVGSKGKETATFGNGTREALKRFQALFIEYIEIADGKFNTKTKTVMNNVCKGPFFTGQGGNIYDMATSTDKIGPVVGISGPTEAEIGTPFRAFIAVSEAIKTPTLVGLIIEGATAGDIRKTSATTFSFLVTPNEDNKGEIKLQLEADAIEDLAKNKNEVASNEWVVIITNAVSDLAATSTDLDTSILDDILNSVTNSLTPTTDCSKVGSVSVYDYTNPCYGRAPTTDPNQTPPPGGEKPPKPPPPIMEMLKGLMDAMKGAGGGQKDLNGKDSAPGACACSGVPTVQHTSIGGKCASGRQQQTGSAPGGGYVNGKCTAPVFPCGIAVLNCNTKQGQQQCKAMGGFSCIGTCCGPTQDTTKLPVVQMQISPTLHGS